jgi:cytochrome P450
MSAAASKRFDFDLSDPALFAAGGHLAALARLRREQPVYEQSTPDGGRFWSVTRYDDLMRVARDHEHFSAADGPTLEPLDAGIFAMAAQTDAITFISDPPEHTAQRTLVNRPFTRRAVAKHEAWIRGLVRERLDVVGDAEEIDLVERVGDVPTRVIAELMGAPREAHDRILEWVMTIGSQGAGVVTPEAQMQAAAAIFGYAGELVEAKRRQPGDDIVSDLVRAEQRGAPLNGVSIGILFLGLVAAGSETTRSATSNGIALLLEHPEELARLRARPELLSTAIEEIVRMSSPVTMFRRTARRATELGGQQLREGDRVAMWFVSANRDEAYFAEPDRFDVARDPNPHLGFGAPGAHYCLGANLARLELEATFSEILAAFASIELAAPPERLPSIMTNAITRLRLRVRRARVIA